MRFVKPLLWQAITLGALSVLGCGGGGGGGGAVLPPATPTSMKQVTPPASAGQVDGFVYASVQTVMVDIAVPSPNTLVTVYDKRPANTVYVSTGNPAPAPITASTPVELARGLTATTPDANSRYHYVTYVTVPTAASSVYVATNASAVVPIVAGKVTVTFDQGGIL